MEKTNFKNGKSKSCPINSYNKPYRRHGLADGLKKLKQNETKKPGSNFMWSTRDSL